jgi:hypothetical protein
VLAAIPTGRRFGGVARTGFKPAGFGFETASRKPAARWGSRLVEKQGNPRRSLAYAAGFYRWPGHCRAKKRRPFACLSHGMRGDGGPGCALKGTAGGAIVAAVARPRPESMRQRLWRCGRAAVARIVLATYSTGRRGPGFVKFLSGWGRAWRRPRDGKIWRVADSASHPGRLAGKLFRISDELCENRACAGKRQR